MLRDRMAAGLPLGGLALAGIFLPGWSGSTIFLLLMLSITLAASHEFFSMMLQAGVRGYWKLTAVMGSLYLFLAAWPGAPVALSTWNTAVFAIFVFACFVRALWTRDLSGRMLASVWVSIGGFIYLYWCLYFLVGLFFLGSGMTGRFLVLYIAAVTKAADMGAYTAGSLTARRPQGNHKLVPSISPKKSWEGLFGGIAASLGISLLLTWLLADRTILEGRQLLSVPAALCIGVLVPLAGLVGDLAESALKRASGRKDSGEIPGLGGALDILDSLIPVAPLFYAYAALALVL